MLPLNGPQRVYQRRFYHVFRYSGQRKAPRAGWAAAVALEELRRLWREAMKAGGD
jgi:hypothetical protein